MGVLSGGAVVDTAAYLLGLDTVGKIETRYRADLVVLPENPLEDVSFWQNTEEVLKASERVR